MFKKEENKIIVLDRRYLESSSLETASNLEDIRELNLRGLKLKGISWDTFTGLTNLETLNLSLNELDEIDSRVLQDISVSLIDLNLNCNRLSRIVKPSRLIILTRLEKLRASWNQITEIDWKGLGELTPSLRHLELNYNRLGRIDADEIKRMSGLEILSLASNRIDKIHNSLDLTINQFSCLKRLDLSNNRLEKVEKNTFQQLNSLKVLNLSRNWIEWIEPGSFGFHLMNLTQLDLSENRLRCIDVGLLEDLNKLEVLDVSRNKIEEIESDAFRDLSNLKELDLSENRLAMISREIFKVFGNENSRICFICLFGNEFEGVRVASFLDRTKDLEGVCLLNGIIRFKDVFENRTGMEESFYKRDLTRLPSPLL